MSSMKKIVECVPNFSEGRDLDKLEKILEPFRGKDGRQAAGLSKR